MGLKEVIIQKIKEEITADSVEVGYSGKTDKEVMDMLNNPVRKTKVVEYYELAPINRILAGLAEAPNIITEIDVAEAKK